MLKNVVKLEAQIEGKTYSLLCDNDSPLPHLKEFLFQCGAYVAQIESNIKAHQEQAKQEAEIKAKSEGKIEALNG